MPPDQFVAKRWDDYAAITPQAQQIHDAFAVEGETAASADKILEYPDTRGNRHAG